MVTVNPAAALRQQSTLGRIRTGFAADLIAMPFHGTATEVFEETLHFAGKVPWTMVNGRPFDP
jgi:imidazolonepropionase-like amidohydrolase